MNESESCKQSPGRLVSLFEAAVELGSPEERIRFLEQECPDPAMRREVEALLAAHDVPDTIFGQTTVHVEAPPAETVGAMIGRYKLLEKLGEGGFGAVWLAEQKEPVRRKVALKVIKLGMDTNQVVARFEVERQALALMDHPNIAKVLDAGTTEGGRPYFVMELVRGIPITKFCDANKLSTYERLDLFIKVCHAVQHAHQKGIIHRDLKPSNVLVTLHDSVPVPKVIDFGIAKATQQELTDKTIHTMFQQFIGTPAYVSPEQAEMSGLDVDTRSDIYSLGVLLYELLTGTTPFDTKELVESGLDEMRKIIREREPVRPSTRLTQHQARVQSQFANRKSQIPSDLDWIVMKCLEKDRTRRYETANGLAADLRRHLHGEPVLARPPTTAYRVQKFVRRNKAAVIAAALVTLLLVAGVIGTSFGLVRARRERANAERAASVANRANAEAQKARAAAEANAQKLEENLYFNRIALAHRELTADPPIIHLAEELLDACPPTMRDWEWHCLKRARFAEPLIMTNNDSKEAYSIAFSPEGRFLAAACGNGQVRIWNLATEQLERTLAAHSNYAFSVAFHPDGHRLASVGADGRVSLWDWTTGVELHSWPGPLGAEDGTAYSLAFSADGRNLAAPYQGGMAAVWDTETFAQRYTLPGHEKRVVSIAFSPDGKRLATGSRHGIVRIWDAATGGLLREMGELGKPLSWVGFRPGSREVAAASFDSAVRLWDLDSPGLKPRQEFRAHYSTVRGAAFSIDGKRLATVGDDGVVALWDPDSGRQVLAGSSISRNPLCVQFSLDGTRMAVSLASGTVYVRDGTPLTGLEDKSLLTLSYPGGIFDMDLSVAGQSLACVGINSDDKAGFKVGPVRVWELGQDRVRRTLAMPGHVAFTLAFDPTGRFLAATGDDAVNPNHRLTVWDLNRDGAQIPFEQFDVNGIWETIAYSPDGKRLVAGGSDKQLDVWDAQTGRKIGVIGNHDREIRALEFSPNGHYLASGSVDAIKLWDAARLDERQDPLLTLSRSRYGDVSLAFSPDGTRLAFASDAGTVHVRDIASTNVVPTLESRAHGFLTLAFSPDGMWIASGGRDCTVKIWEAGTGRLRHTFRGQKDQINRVAFAQLPQGLRLLSASMDGTVKYWDVTALEKE
ncbi:MAG TPA: serine/threonine-protein kinase [Candidatus Limnocylindrales bacterium]|jgi:WD40 repeat protein|nr:serine/threonine-protein kinase [Candidatus Limnocylindrales bacterium]